MGNWDVDRFTRTLSAATGGYDRALAEKLCDELVAHLAERPDPYPEKAARGLLRCLREARYFDVMARVADVLLRAQADSPWLQRDHAQALLDLGQVRAAVAVLERLRRTPDLAAPIADETEGLLGRAYKQMFVDAKLSAGHARPALFEAVRRYHGVYATNPDEYLWHGVNAATLLFRARRDGIGGLDAVDPEAIAKRVVAAVADRALDGRIQQWDYASEAEALIGLGRFADAAASIAKYVAFPTVEAFELGSMLRQLTEVVELDQSPGEERYLVDVVRAALLRRAGGGFTAGAGDVNQRARCASEAERGLQKVFGAERYVDHRWLLTAFRRAVTVARVSRRGRPVGTGFVLPGEALSREWKDSQVFLTNNHVVSSTRPATPRHEEIELGFDALDEGRAAYRAIEVLWESPVAELDTTVLRLDRHVEGIGPTPLAAAVPAVADPPRRMYVIGHPLGQNLAYSLYDNLLLASSPTRIHYRSPTEEGSSGSPVFDEHWDLVAIHHSGADDLRRLDDPTQRYQANEGIPLRAIVDALAAK